MGLTMNASKTKTINGYPGSEVHYLSTLAYSYCMLGTGLSYSATQQHIVTCSMWTLNATASTTQTPYQSKPTFWTTAQTTQGLHGFQSSSQNVFALNTNKLHFCSMLGYRVQWKSQNPRCNEQSFQPSAPFWCHCFGRRRPSHTV
jgi:hypothetical protein